MHIYICFIYVYKMGTKISFKNLIYFYYVWCILIFSLSFIKKKTY